MRGVVRNAGLYPVFEESQNHDSKWGRPIPIPIGYLGTRRDQVKNHFDENYGDGNWRVVWYDKKKRTILDFLRMCVYYYQKSYFEFLSGNPHLVEFLQTNALNVCAEDASDLEAGCNYLVQKGKRTQILAIVVRNVMADMGIEFRGKELIYLRGPKISYEICRKLDPRVVPFCNPEKIFHSWYSENEKKPFSVEDFYQNNKFLQLRRRGKAKK